VVSFRSGVDCKRPLHRRYAIAKPASRQSQLPGKNWFQPFHRCAPFQSFQSFNERTGTSWM